MGYPKHHFFQNREKNNGKMAMNQWFQELIIRWTKNSPHQVSANRCCLTGYGPLVNWAFSCPSSLSISGFHFHQVGAKPMNPSISISSSQIVGTAIKRPNLAGSKCFQRGRRASKKRLACITSTSHHFAESLLSWDRTWYPKRSNLETPGFAQAGVLSIKRKGNKWSFRCFQLFRTCFWVPFNPFVE